MLIIFTAGFPVVIFLLLFMNRKRLQTPSVRAQLGFLYVSFRPNAGEFWEVHELLRKLMLMGALVLIESTKVRMIVALLVCVVSVMSLNYFRPHKNVVVLCVAQVSFLLTSFKYILAIVLDDVTQDERMMLGWVLIFLDVCFVLGSICSLFAVVYVLSSRVKEENEEERSSGEKVLKVAGSTTKVVPSRNVNKQLQGDIRAWGRDGGGGGDDDGGKNDTSGAKNDTSGAKNDKSGAKNDTISAAQQRRESRRSSHRRSINSEHAKL
jgi:hypothetical protein